MARAPVQTSKKRTNRRKEELRAPDEVTTALQKLSDHLSKHLKLYGFGLVAVLAVSLGLQVLVDSYAQAAVDRSTAALAAFEAANGTVATFADDEKLISLDPSAPVVAEKPEYDTDTARWTAAEAELAKAKEAAGGDFEALLGALNGRIQMAKGDNAAAGTAFAAFASEEDDSLLLPIVFENQGRAAENAGDIAGAAGFYEKLAGLEDPYYKMRGGMLLGDLYNPSLRGGKGDAAKAKSHYDAALAALVPGEGQVATGPIRGLRAEILRRKSAL